jgi:ribulose-bisphosphate carboxylase large chain
MKTFFEVKNNATDESRFSVVYRITCDNKTQVEEIAKDITFEQTVEVPVDCIPEHVLKSGIIGNVESITPSKIINKYDVAISYRCAITDYAIPQLLNVIFGNISLKNNIKVIGLDFPGSFLDQFQGPKNGIDIVRQKTGAQNRPLACTALKPMGLSVLELSAMAGAFAKGGVDLIKDDHGISNQPFHPFKERVSRCQEAVNRETARTGKNTIYCPMVSGRFDEIEEQVAFAAGAGVQGILIAPMLVGCDTVRYISEKYDMIVIGHPSLTGTFFNDPDHGMAPSVLLGTIFRILGVDINVFPNFGGRFSFTMQECIEIACALKDPLGNIKSAFPCPAGGMSFERIPNIAQDYGVDTVILIGGSLMQHGNDIAESTKIFMNKIKEQFRQAVTD